MFKFYLKFEFEFEKIDLFFDNKELISNLIIFKFY